jgi:hypothetical protein
MCILTKWLLVVKYSDIWESGVIYKSKIW